MIFLAYWYVGVGVLLSVQCCRVLRARPDRPWEWQDNLLAMITVVGWLPMLLIALLPKKAS